MSGDADRLYRSRSNRKLLGVCGGLGEYFGVDPTIPRVAFVVLGALSLGTWLLIYFVMALVIPEEPEGFVDTMAATPEEEPTEESSAGESE
jgi:phage shock protein PspC (stress-responsive transcriptional regulator)